MFDKASKCVACLEQAEFVFPVMSLLDCEDHSICGDCVDAQAEPVHLVEKAVSAGLDTVDQAVLDVVTAYHAGSGRYLSLDGWSRCQDQDEVRRNWPPALNEGHQTEPATDCTFRAEVEEADFQAVRDRLYKIKLNLPPLPVDMSPGPEETQTSLRFETPKPKVGFFAWLQQYI